MWESELCPFCTLAPGLLQPLQLLKLGGWGVGQCGGGDLGLNAIVTARNVLNISLCVCVVSLFGFLLKKVELKGRGKGWWDALGIFEPWFLQIQRSVPECSKALAMHNFASVGGGSAIQTHLMGRSMATLIGVKSWNHVGYKWHLPHL